MQFNELAMLLHGVTKLANILHEVPCSLFKFRVNLSKVIHENFAVLLDNSMALKPCKPRSRSRFVVMTLNKGLGLLHLLDNSVFS